LSVSSFFLGEEMENFVLVPRVLRALPKGPQKAFHLLSFTDRVKGPERLGGVVQGSVYPEGSDSEFKTVVNRLEKAN